MSGVWLRRMRAVAALAAAAILPAVQPVIAAAAPGPPTLRTSGPADPRAVPGEIVVGFRSGVGGSERAAARSDAQVQVTRELLTPRTQLVKAERGQTVADAIAALEKRSEVR